MIGAYPLRYPSENKPAPQAMVGQLRSQRLLGRAASCCAATDSRRSTAGLSCSCFSSRLFLRKFIASTLFPADNRGMVEEAGLSSSTQQSGSSSAALGSTTKDRPKDGARGRGRTVQCAESKRGKCSAPALYLLFPERQKLGPMLPCCSTKVEVISGVEAIEVCAGDRRPRTLGRDERIEGEALGHEELPRLICTPSLG